MPLPNYAFLDAISRWRNDIPLKNLWVVNLNVPRLQQVQANIKTMMIACENQLSSEAWPVIDFTGEIRPDLGYMFCRGMNLIGDGVDVSALEIENRGGLRPGFVTGNRQAYSGFTLDVLETNLDIIDFLLRPWVIAMSHYGLIKDEFDLCCDIEVQMYTRIDRVKDRLLPNEIGTQWQLRKIFTFFDCYPTNVEADKLSYDGMSDISSVSKSSTWYFRDYFISSPDYGDLTFTYNQQLPLVLRSTETITTPERTGEVIMGPLTREIPPEPIQGPPIPDIINNIPGALQA
jgi:hypothetical protein